MTLSPFKPGLSPYPKLEISLNKISHNTEVVVRMCQRFGINVVGVTKGCCGQVSIANAMVDGGIKTIGDSRLENLKRLNDIGITKLLLRLPMISQASNVVEYADISINSEIETIRALSEVAQLKNRTHQVILMFDLGDLREGIFTTDEMFRVVEQTLKFKRIRIAGIGTNLTCYGGVIPTKENLTRLVELKKTIEGDFDILLGIVSGGNSSSLYLLEEDTMPDGINQLRLGESILLGSETAYRHRIKGTYDDCFRLIAEIIEIKDKPSIPTGELGLDAFGNTPEFAEKGIRKRAICAIGKQDIHPQDLVPEDKKIKIIGASSDHLILDITDCKSVYRIGSLISFNLTYGGILSSMTSEYVSKSFK
jgi:predicted amino acid racemase